MSESVKNIELKHKIWIETNDGTSILGEGKYVLLKAIEEEGSFVAAIHKLNLSYRKTWNKMKEIEDKLGFPLLETTRGGKTGGSSRLTDKARILIDAFDKYHGKIDIVVQKAFSEFYLDLERSGF